MKAESTGCLLIFFLTCSVFGDDEDVLIRKLATANSLSASHFLIPLDEKMFDYYINEGPRNYSFIIIIGTETVECEICRVVQDSLRNIAKSWVYENPTQNNLFFGIVDFSISGDLVNRLNIETAPFVIHFPPHGDKKSDDKLNDFQTLISPQLLVKWIYTRTGSQVKFHTPRDYTALKQLLAILIVFFLPAALGFISIRTAIALLVLVFITSMLSGAMWISINSPPWTISKDSETHLYIKSADVQLAFEAVIIFGLYSCTSIGVVLLTQKCTKLRGVKRSLSIIVSLAMAVLGFNQLAEYYALKNGYLPYHRSLL